MNNKISMNNQAIDQWGPIDAKVLYMSFWFGPIAHSGETKWQALWPKAYGVYSKDRITYFWYVDEMQDRGKRVIENIILNDKNRQALWQKYQAIVKKDFDFSENIFKISEETKQDEKLYDILKTKAKKLYELSTSTWDLGIIPEVANFAAAGYLKEKLPDNIAEENISEILEVLLASDKLSYHQQSEYELLQAALENNFSDYADKWFWVENGYYESKILDKNYFKDQVKDLSEEEIKNKLDKIKNYPKEVNKRKKDLAKKYKLSKDVLNISDNLAYSIWWQDHRKAVALYLQSTIDVFSKAAAKHLGINFEDILYYMAEEWLALFEGKKVPDTLLKTRYDMTIFSILPDDKKVIEDNGQAAHKLIEDLNLYDDKHDDESEIKGTPVSRGKVSGKVRVLLSHRQADNMAKGEILVAPMTSPDYIIAMRKAKAIITDVGGLMSHAAIVSRELGVPCVVGTKIATKVLKDGDLVEVDADKGLVTKI